VRVSPDCRWAVWVKSALDEKKGEHVSHLMLSSLVEDKEIQLTRGDVSCTQPRWSPDGEHISFIAARAAPGEAEKGADGDEKPKPQLWVMHAFGGEPWPLTAGERGVQGQDWADAKTIVYAAQEERTLYEMRLKEHKDGSIVVDDEEHAPPVRLFKVALADKAVVRLTDNGDRIRGLSLSLDGRRAVTIHERSLHYEYDNRVKPLVFVYDLETGARTQVLDDPQVNVRHVVWARDGTGFYAISAYSRHPQYVMAAISRLYYYDLASGSAVQVDLAWENGLAHWEQTFDVTPDGFVALLADGARPRVARYARSGDHWRREWLSGEHAGQLYALQVGTDGATLLYEYTTTSTPNQWYRARLSGGRIEEAAQLTHINKRLGERACARAEVVRWAGANA
jgi:Tol biopolymer transport system component